MQSPEVTNIREGFEALALSLAAAFDHVTSELSITERALLRKVEGIGLPDSQKTRSIAEAAKELGIIRIGRAQEVLNGVIEMLFADVRLEITSRHKAIDTLRIYASSPNRALLIASDGQDDARDEKLAASYGVTIDELGTTRSALLERMVEILYVEPQSPPETPIILPEDPPPLAQPALRQASLKETALDIAQAVPLLEGARSHIASGNVDMWRTQIHRAAVFDVAQAVNITATDINIPGLSAQFEYNMARFVVSNLDKLVSGNAELARNAFLSVSEHIPKGGKLYFDMIELARGLNISPASVVTSRGNLPSQLAAEIIVEAKVQYARSGLIEGWDIAMKQAAKFDTKQAVQSAMSFLDDVALADDDRRVVARFIGYKIETLHAVDGGLAHKAFIASSRHAPGRGNLRNKLRKVSQRLGYAGL